MWLYLLIFVFLAIILTGLIALKFFCYEKKEFTTIMKLLIAIDIVLIILQIYLYATSNLGFFILGLVFQAFYIVLVLVNLKK